MMALSFFWGAVIQATTTTRHHRHAQQRWRWFGPQRPKPCRLRDARRMPPRNRSSTAGQEGVVAERVRRHGACLDVGHERSVQVEALAPNGYQRLILDGAQAVDAIARFRGHVQWSRRELSAAGT